jgi:mRNA interferase MazF
MNIKKWNVYLTDLNPGHKAEPGKVRPAVVVQTDLLNNTHPTTIICPITTKVQTKSLLLRVHIKKTEGGLKQVSDILVDQIRAIDNSRFQKRLGVLDNSSIVKLRECLNLILD